MSEIDKDCELQYSSGKRLKSKTCCENQHQVLDMDDNVEIATAYQIINPIFLIAFVHTFVQPLFLKVAALIHNSLLSAEGLNDTCVIEQFSYVQSNLIELCL